MFLLIKLISLYLQILPCFEGQGRFPNHFDGLNACSHAQRGGDQRRIHAEYENPASRRKSARIASRAVASPAMNSIIESWNRLLR